MSVLTEKTNIIVIAIGIVGFLITFLGIKFESCSLSIFIIVFLYTLVESGKTIVAKKFPGLVSKLPKNLNETFISGGDTKILWGVVIVIVIGTMLVLILFKWIKLITMILITYLIWNMFIKKHVKIPTTINWMLALGIVVFIILLYAMLQSVYRVIFAIGFALYGSLFVLSVCFCLASKDNKFGMYIISFLDNPIVIKDPLLMKEAIKKSLLVKETLYWGVMTLAGFSVQIFL